MYVKVGLEVCSFRVLTVKRHKNVTPEVSMGHWF